MKIKKTIKKHRNLILRLIDIFVIIIAYYVAVILVNNTYILSKEYNQIVINTIILAIVVYSSILHLLRTYKNITRYENGNDYLIYAFACFISFGLVTVVKFIFQGYFLNTVTNAISALLIVVGIIGYRVFLRLLLTQSYNHLELENSGNKKNVLIIGAGGAAKTVLGTLKSAMRDTYHVVGLIDDNVNKISYTIAGSKIIGDRYDIPRICKENKVEIILFTISNIDTENRKDILKICQETGCKVRILPGTEQLIKDKNLMSSFRDVEIEDLLRKRPC